MRARRHFMIFSGILAACGGDDQSTTATMATMTSVSGTVTASTNPSGDTVTSGPGESDSSATAPTSEGSTTAPVAGAPVFLSLQTNVSKITAGESVIFTAVLTDPDGVDDIVGGTLSDETGMIGYGPFVAAGQEGTYSMSLSWDAVHQADPIQFEGMDLGRVFRAEFYDQAANKVHKDVKLTLTCVEGSACDGICTNIMTNTVHCGSCAKACEGGCDVGQCAPKWGECIDKKLGFSTCDAYCGSIGEACVENGCGDGATTRAYGGYPDCQKETLYTSVDEPCAAVQTWSIGSGVIQCCCTDTP